MYPNVLKRTEIKTKGLIILLTVVSAVALPQIFHALGVVSGAGSLPGQIFLPMHIPVLIAALVCGPAVGLISGLISPIISFAVSGMPAVTLLPFMIIELGAYGLSAGLLFKVNMPTVAKLLVAQVAGRAIRAATAIIAVYGFDSQALTLASILSSITTALPGIVLQWALIPLAVYRIKSIRK